MKYEEIAKECEELSCRDRFRLAQLQDFFGSHHFYKRAEEINKRRSGDDV